jgi:D-alanyl-lipoteichoic acid acyltransferase DltB (MBOAT superfamily)
MLFNSFHFFLFFPVVTLLYFALAHRFRWILLLAASYYFYMCWRPEYIVLIMISTTVDYFAAIKIEDARAPRVRKYFLLTSLVVNFGLLFSFKYFNFIAATLSGLLALVHAPVSIPALDVLLPVGISFYTFQEVSYVIDVYRGHLPAQRHLGVFALYVSYFPQLVAGPIERSPRLMPQLTERHQFNTEDAVYGLRMILWGMCKKVVIADNLATWVDAVYEAPGACPGPVLALGTICFAFQIYCDFSGYSDIAVGSARIMGISLMRNFDRPYLSRSIPEFWQRWHISLSTWFRDYVYIPLGGSRVSPWRWYANILIVFAVSGLWHGANWTFVVWGTLHGSYYVIGKLLARPRAALVAVTGLGKVPRLRAVLQTALTFVLACFAWIFFRAPNMESAWAVISGLPFGWDLLLHLNYGHFASVMAVLSGADVGSGIVYGSVLTACIVSVLGYDMYMRHSDWAEVIDGYHVAVRWASYVVICLAVLNLGVSRVIPFQYFQF